MISTLYAIYRNIDEEMPVATDVLKVCTNTGLLNGDINNRGSSMHKIIAGKHKQ